METKYSHAFFVGNFGSDAASGISPSRLDALPGWRRGEEASLREVVYSLYYKAHVDAMMEFGSDRPEFLRQVCHYRHECGCRLAIRGRTQTYAFTLCALHIYFFPFDTVMFALEVDDSGCDLCALVDGHFLLSQRLNDMISSGELAEALKPLTSLLPGNDPSALPGDGNKLKIFQLLNIPYVSEVDRLLFEVATSTPVGCVGSDHFLAPSQEYFERIIHENKVSVFKDWSGLALVDSFTCINCSPEMDSNQKSTWINFYFPLIYLRCLFEKSFCISRNMAYRMDRSVQNLSSEIALMDRYYFYNTISYTFLPNLLYEAMSRGIGLHEERRELSEQVREQAHEEHEKEKERSDRRLKFFTVLLSVFAIFSVFWDICSMLDSAYPGMNLPVVANVLLYTGVGAVIAVIVWMMKRKTK